MFTISIVWSFEVKLRFSSGSRIIFFLLPLEFLIKLKVFKLFNKHKVEGEGDYILDVVVVIVQ
jgi:hypothetical protein